jgi:uncharacterized protein (DUF983 family)
MGRPRLRTMLWRGLRKRCARCGRGAIFRTYLRLHERCPSCGYRFEREPGFWMMVYLVNYAFTAIVVIALIAGYVWWVAGHGVGATLVPFIILAEVVAAAAHFGFYPIAKSLWAAIDLASRPLEPDEEEEAARFTQ